MLLYCLRVAGITALFLGCCFSSPYTYAARKKSTPSKACPTQTLGVISTGDVAVNPSEGVSIRSLGETLCFQDAPNDHCSIRCQGGEQATQFTLTGATHLQTLEIEADALTQIEDASTICRISTGEDESPAILCDSSPKGASPVPCQAYCSDYESNKTGLQLQIQVDEPLDLPGKYRITVRSGKRQSRKSGNKYRQRIPRVTESIHASGKYNGAELYVCDRKDCGKRFRRNSNLTRHKRTRTPGGRNPISVTGRVVANGLN